MAAASMTATTRGAFIVWHLTAADPEGEWAAAFEHPMKTMIIEGGLATLYGCASKGGQEFELSDEHGDKIKSPGICNITMNPMSIRPKMISGDAVTVSIIATKG